MLPLYLHNTHFLGTPAVTPHTAKLIVTLKQQCCWMSPVLQFIFLQERGEFDVQMQAQEAEQRAEAVEEAVKQPARTAVKLYITSALTAVLSFVVVSGTASNLVDVVHAQLPMPCCLQQCCHLQVALDTELSLLQM